MQISIEMLSSIPYGFINVFYRKMHLTREFFLKVWYLCGFSQGMRKLILVFIRRFVENKETDHHSIWKG